MSSGLFWKDNWQECKQNLVRWWNHDGLVLCLTSKRSHPLEEIDQVNEPVDIERRWIDPDYRCMDAERFMAQHSYLAESFPFFDTQIGPGSLCTFLGAQPHFVEGTVWYEACIQDAEKFGAIRFNPSNNHWLDVHLALIDKGLNRSKGRYLVGMPDMIENLDTLAALRGDTAILYDLIERPAWVIERLAEINQAYYAAFDLIYQKIKGAEGGNAFSAFALWGPGKTAKVQCDISASISARMFRKFVAPFLTEQCRWLDYALYHLDGTTALQHVEPLLEIEPLEAIEWTPQAGLADGGSPEWYDLYRRIKAGGKSVQVIGVGPEDMLPLLDAIGPKGTFIIFKEPVDEATAEKLLRAAEPYYKG